MMTSWADTMIHEYSEGRKQLSNLHKELDSENPANEADLKHINSMMNDLDYAMKWLKTGIQPGTSRGINDKSIYQKQHFESIEVIPDITEQLFGEEKPEKSLFLTQEEKKVLADVLTSFSLRERQCYLMHVCEGMSMQKIADKLGVAKGTVQNAIERARKKVEAAKERNERRCG